MRILCPLILLLLSAISTAAQDSLNNMADYFDVRGMVKCITYKDSIAAEIYTTISCGGIGNYFDSGYTMHTKDEHGNQVSCVFYDKDSNYLHRVNCKYDVAHNRTEIAYIDINGKLMQTCKYRYNSTGYPIERTTYDSNGAAFCILPLNMKFEDSHFKECYDKKGRRTYMYNFMCGIEDSTNWHEIDSKIKETEKTKYSMVDTNVLFDNGRKLVTITYKKDEQTWQCKYLYNEQGNEIEIIEENINDIPENKHVLKKQYDQHQNLLLLEHNWYINNRLGCTRNEYTYDNSGHKIRHKYYTLRYDGLPTIEEWNKKRPEYTLEADTLYDNNGYIIQTIQYKRGIAYTRIVYTNNSHGDVVHTKVYDKNNSLISESFGRYEEYDSHNNWLEQLSWSWNIDDFGYKDYVPHVRHRSIEYYK